MRTRISLVLACLGSALGCGSSDDGGTPSYMDDCPTGAETGTLAIEIALDANVPADVGVLRANAAVGERVRESTERSLSAGPYTLVAHRLRSPGALVGAAFQGSVDGGDTVCVRAGQTTRARVAYTREPGSNRLWVTQSNADGPQVVAFDPAALEATGAQTPSASLSPRLNNAGPMAVDGEGRLWVASNTGQLVGYAASQLGSGGAQAPAIQIDGASVCEQQVPCGPTALAFDAQGGLWIATPNRIVKLAAESLVQSGEPLAAVTITSPDAPKPRALAFDAAGNLWVADAGGAIVKLPAATLAHDSDHPAAAIVIFARQPGPVEVLLGEPEGMVFDRDGQLWVGYFGGNNLVRFTTAELERSASSSSPLVPSHHFKIGTEALVTDLALDEAGNLWLPGGPGSLYRIDASELSQPEPKLRSLTSSAIGSAEKLVLHSVPGPLFIAP